MCEAKGRGKAGRVELKGNGKPEAVYAWVWRMATLTAATSYSPPWLQSPIQVFLVLCQLFEPSQIRWLPKANTW